MATYLGKNATALSANKKAGSGEVNGHVKTMYEEFTLTAEMAASADVLVAGAPLPKGARVLSVVLKSPALGGSGTTDVGYQANGVDAASTNGFIAAAATGAGAVQSSGSGAAIGKKFDAETQVQLAFTGVTTSGIGKTLQLWVQYIVD